MLWCVQVGWLEVKMRLLIPKCFDLLCLSVDVSFVKEIRRHQMNAASEKQMYLGLPLDIFLFCCFVVHSAT